jgi:hypothetical protein
LKKTEELKRGFISTYKNLNERYQQLYEAAFWEAVDFIMEKLEVQGIERKNERSTRNKKSD